MNFFNVIVCYEFSQISMKTMLFTGNVLFFVFTISNAYPTPSWNQRVIPMKLKNDIAHERGDLRQNIQFNPDKRIPIGWNFLANGFDDGLLDLPGSGEYFAQEGQERNNSPEDNLRRLHGQLSSSWSRPMYMVWHPTKWPDFQETYELINRLLKNRNLQARLLSALDEKRHVSDHLLSEIKTHAKTDDVNDGGDEFGFEVTLTGEKEDELSEVDAQLPKNIFRKLNNDKVIANRLFGNDYKKETYGSHKKGHKKNQHKGSKHKKHQSHKKKTGHNKKQKISQKMGDIEDKYEGKNKVEEIEDKNEGDFETENVQQMLFSKGEGKKKRIERLKQKLNILPPFNKDKPIYVYDHIPEPLNTKLKQLHTTTGVFRETVNNPRIEFKHRASSQSPPFQNMQEKREDEHNKKQVLSADENELEQHEIKFQEQRLRDHQHQEKLNSNANSHSSVPPKDLNNDIRFENFDLKSSQKLLKVNHGRENADKNTHPQQDLFMLYVDVMNAQNESENGEVINKKRDFLSGSQNLAQEEDSREGKNSKENEKSNMINGVGEESRNSDILSAQKPLDKIHSYTVKSERPRRGKEKPKYIKTNDIYNDNVSYLSKQKEREDRGKAANMMPKGRRRRDNETNKRGLITNTDSRDSKDYPSDYNKGKKRKTLTKTIRSVKIDIKNDNEDHRKENDDKIFFSKKNEDNHDPKKIKYEDNDVNDSKKINELKKVIEKHDKKKTSKKEKHAKVSDKSETGGHKQADGPGILTVDSAVKFESEEKINATHQHSQPDFKKDKTHLYHHAALGLVLLALLLSLVVSMICFASWSSNSEIRRVNSRTALFRPGDLYAYNSTDQQGTRRMSGEDIHENFTYLE